MAKLKARNLRGNNDLAILRDAVSRCRCKSHFYSKVANMKCPHCMLKEMSYNGL